MKKIKANFVVIVTLFFQTALFALYITGVAKPHNETMGMLVTAAIGLSMGITIHAMMTTHALQKFADKLIDGWQEYDENIIKAGKEMILKASNGKLTIH